MESLEIKKKRTNQRFAIGEGLGDDGLPEVNILWVPYLPAFEHDHINLSFKEAKKLSKWLKKFVKEHEGKILRDSEKTE